jgi:hypothetical protein
MAKEPHPSQRKRLERERTMGLDPKDDASTWLTEHDPPPTAPEPKAGRKSVTLHRWRQAQQRKSKN